MIKKIAVTTGLAAALVTGAASWKSTRNEQAAMASHPPLGDFITIDGTRVHYLIEGAGPAIVLIHGAGGNMRDFTFELSGKLTQTHTVITFDRPGHGYTDILHDDGESPMEQAVLLKAATDALGYSSAIIAGYSYGGAVALAWALEYPNATDGLITMNAVSNPWTIPPSKLYELAAGNITGPIMATALSAFAPQTLVEDTMQSLFAPQATPEGYLDYIGVGLTLRRSTLRANGKQVHTLLPHIEAQSVRYPEFKMPVEIIHGTDDITIPPSIHADVLATQLPDAVYTRVPNVGHSVHHYAHDAILAAVERIEKSK